MQNVDGFTLIDYIKSSIEILMNMKIEENEGFKNHESNNHKRKHHRHQENQGERAGIPKIDDKTPTSSILDL